MGPGLETLGAALWRCVTGVLACRSYVVGVVRATAFWGTVLLPFVILGGLASDLVTAAPVELASLFGLNVLCILFGRGYRPGE